MSGSTPHTEVSTFSNRNDIWKYKNEDSKIFTMDFNGWRVMKIMKTLMGRNHDEIHKPEVDSHTCASGIESQSKMTVRSKIYTPFALEGPG